jgi:acyl dehydratase
MPGDPPVGRSWPAHTYEVGREKIREYAAAIGAFSELHREHEAARAAGFRAAVAPPLFAAVYVAPAVASVIFDPSVGVFDPRIGLAGYRFVQRTQEFEWGEPVCAGDTIETVASLAEAGDRDGTAFRVFESVSTNQRGDVVVRGRYEGVVPGPRTGTRPPRRVEPEPEPGGDPPAWSPGPVAELHEGTELPALAVTPDRYAGTRYAGASGDFTPFHLDDEFARAIGLPGIILHGLYVIALLSRGLIEPYGGDPRVLRRLSARLRAPAVPDAELVTHAVVQRIAEGAATIVCDVSQGGRRVIGNGEATIADPPAIPR